MGAPVLMPCGVRTGANIMTDASLRGELDAVERMGGVGRSPKSAALGWLA